MIEESEKPSLPTKEVVQAESAQKSIERAEKQNVAAWSVFAAFSLTATKAIVGFTTGSLGIISEALHSSLDLLAAVITWFAVKFSGKPADEEHQYGHSKIEGLSALAEILLLMITCFWIVLEATERLSGKHTGVLEVNIWSFAVMTLSVFVGIQNSRNLYAMAEKHQSQALAADALHFSSDVISSLVVVVGLVFSKLGYPMADPIAALGVAILVSIAAWQMGRSALDVLLDKAPAGMADGVRDAAMSVPGVLGLNRLRVRGAGGKEGFADVTLSLANDMGFEQAHGISYQVEQAIHTAFPGIEVQMRFEPGHHANEDLLTRIRRMAMSHRGVVNLHNLEVLDGTDNLHVVLHIEVEETMSLSEAHSISSQLEAGIRALDKRIQHVVSHIEPASSQSCHIQDITTTNNHIVIRVIELCGKIAGLSDPHNIRILSAGTRLNFEMHARTAGTTTVAHAHKLAIALEGNILQFFPQLATVVIHLEPLK
ncbi:MAG: cation-efflux pump [Candidatus Riflebacteria bacterium]|nr:cation-efflux pump [Candidatus Riflebacteria bacterium]